MRFWCSKQGLGQMINRTNNNWTFGERTRANKPDTNQIHPGS